MTERAACGGRTARRAGRRTLVGGRRARNAKEVSAATPSTPPRVLLANLGPMVRVGMLRLLREGGIEVVGEQPPSTSIAAEVELLQPDIVVFDLDQTDSQQLGELVRLACPHAKVVLWAPTEDVMEVIDPGATRPRWVLSGVPDDLLAEMSTVK